MILRYWKLFKKYPLGKSFFSWCIGFYVPYSGSISAEVLELERGYAKLLMRDRRRLRNHLQSIHAAALMNFAELTSGMAFICDLGPEIKAIVTGFQMDYLRKARGDLIGECHCTPPATSVEQKLLVEALIRDSKGDIVARGTATWFIRPVPA